MEIMGHTIYTVNASEFASLVQKRIRDLEATLLSKIIEHAETRSAKALSASKGMPTEVERQYNEAIQRIEDDIADLRCRIDAVRDLTDEFNEVKHD